MSAFPQQYVAVEAAEQLPDEKELIRNTQDTQDQAIDYEFEVKEQDRWLPIANVARIMKTALPDNAKIAKEAKECMQECVSEFISFITSEASDKCQQEKRKTINGEDILFAMTLLGFENYTEALKIYLTKCRKTQTARRMNQARPSGGNGGIVGPSSNANASSATGAGEGFNKTLREEGVEKEGGASTKTYRAVKNEGDH